MVMWLCGYIAIRVALVLYCCIIGCEARNLFGLVQMTFHKDFYNWFELGILNYGLGKRPDGRYCFEMATLSASRLGLLEKDIEAMRNKALGRR